MYSLFPLLKLCQNTHMLTRDLPTSFSTSFVTSSVSVCTFPLFSGGERRYERDRVRVSLQLWDGERQENRHCFGNRYSFRLYPLLLVRHSFKPFASVLHQYKPCLLCFLVVVYHSNKTWQKQSNVIWHGEVTDMFWLAVAVERQGMTGGSEAKGVRDKNHGVLHLYTCVSHQMEASCLM